MPLVIFFSHNEQRNHFVAAGDDSHCAEFQSPGVVHRADSHSSGSQSDGVAQLHKTDACRLHRIARPFHFSVGPHEKRDLFGRASVGEPRPGTIGIAATAAYCQKLQSADLPRPKTTVEALQLAKD